MCNPKNSTFFNTLYSRKQRKGVREEEKKKTITSKIVPTLDIWVGSSRGGLNPLWPGKESVAKDGRRKDGARRNGSIKFKNEKERKEKKECI